MATGSITSLGIGSGLDLQNILDQLKEADNIQITNKEVQKEAYQEEINAYNTINAKLFAMKSDALALSLQSNYIKTSNSLTDEDILDAVISDGIEESSYTIDVTQKAQRNSWESAGVSSAGDIMFSEPDTDIAGTDDVVTTTSETMSIFYGETGSEQQIDVSLTAGMSLPEIVDEINSSSNNQDGDGTQLVQASLATNEEDEYYIRLSAVNGGNTVDSEITVAGFTYIQPDTTTSITQDDISMYLSIAAGSTYQQVANLINDSSDNPGLTAAMIDNGDSSNPYQLTLTADNTGEDARITLSNLALDEVTGAGAASLDAMFTVDGIAYRRQSNSSITDVITGITLNLKNLGETTINIESELDSVKEDIVSLVDGFNNLVSSINGSNSKTDEDTTNDESLNSLSDSYDVKRLISNLTSLMTTIIDIDSEYTSLTDIGMEIDKDGTISLDEDILDQAIASDPDAVASLFLGDSDDEITGIADLLNDGLTDMVSSSGIVSTETDALESMVARLDKDIETATERLDKKYATMAADFARLDGYIRQLNSEASYMQSMFDSLNTNDDT